MAQELRYCTFATDTGWIGLLASEEGLVTITLPRQSDGDALQELGGKANQAIWSPELFTDLAERLKNYFSGKREEFIDRLDLSGATSFQREVWGVARRIPYGETRSYLWVAEQLEKPKAARAVGQALGRNPLPVIVPCHRVIASDGKLGGFSGGLELKQHLLRLEAIPVASALV